MYFGSKSSVKQAFYRPRSIFLLIFKFGRSSLYCFLSYVGIQMLEEVSLIYPSPLNHVSGRLKRNFFFSFSASFIIRKVFSYE